MSLTEYTMEIFNYFEKRILWNRRFQKCFVMPFWESESWKDQLIRRLSSRLFCWKLERNMILMKKVFQMFNPGFHIFDCSMFGFRMKFKIIQRIICFVTIFMMNMFPPLKGAAKILRHYQSMFVNFTSFIGHGMMYANKYFNITMICWMATFGAISKFFFPSRLYKTFSTKARKSMLANLSKHHIISPPSNIAAFNTSYFNEFSNDIIFISHTAYRLKINTMGNCNHVFNILYLTEQINREV